MRRFVRVLICVLVVVAALAEWRCKPRIRSSNMLGNVYIFQLERGPTSILVLNGNLRAPISMAEILWRGIRFSFAHHRLRSL